MIDMRPTAQPVIPTGHREITCKCGVTFTVAVKSRRKRCVHCRTTRSIDADGYTQVCISVYADDLNAWHEKVAQMRKLGVRRPSVSELIRRAVEAYEVKP